MNYSFPRACEACGQENGVGFKDGQWRCDACLGNPDGPEEPEKSPRSRRIFVVQAISPSPPHADVTNRSPPLGERAAEAVMRDRKRSGGESDIGKHGGKTAGSQPLPLKKMRGGKKQTSRSQRFSNRRKP